MNATRRVLTTMTLAAAALAAASANAAAVIIPESMFGLCEQHTFEYPFAAFGDSAPYTLVPGGDFESTLPGWTLEGKAGVVRDKVNNLGVGRDVYALSIPAGGRMTTPQVCVTNDYPYFRLFARSASPSGSRLKVEVIYEATTPATVIPVGDLDGSTMAAWKPTPRLSTAVSLATIGANLSQALAILDGSATLTTAGPMRIRLTATGGTWLVDNVYVDPRMR